MRLKSSQTTERGERGVAEFHNVSRGDAIVACVVGCAYLFGGENASELEMHLDNRNRTANRCEGTSS